MSPASALKNTYKFPESAKLSSSESYLGWIYRIKRFLRNNDLGLANFVETGKLPIPVEDETQKKKKVLREQADAAVFMLIRESLQPEVSKRLPPDIRGADIMSHLAQSYVNPSIKEEYYYFKKVCNQVSAKSVRNMEQAIDAMQKLSYQLEGVYPLPGYGWVFLALTLIDSPMAENLILTSCPENVTLEYCRRMAVPFIRNLSNTDQVSNQVSYSQPDSETKTRRTKSKRRSRKEIVCFRCQQRGHTATICPAPVAIPRTMAHMREESNLDITSGATVQKDMDYAMRLGPLDDESYWLGSGCTIHISNNKSHFDSFTPCDGFVEGIGAQCAVEGKGTITLRNGPHRLQLVGVRYVPQSQKNLISLQKLVNVAGNVTMGKDSIVLNSVEIGTLCANKLYRATFKPTPYFAAALAVSPGYMHPRYKYPFSAVSE